MWWGHRARHGLAQALGVRWADIQQPKKISKMIKVKPSKKNPTERDWSIHVIHIPIFLGVSVNGDYGYNYELRWGSSFARHPRPSGWESSGLFSLVKATECERIFT